MDLKYWRYFLSIEEDFIKTLRYVELSKDNLKTYSIEYTRLLVSACAEIETILKLICKTTGSNCNNFNISKLKKKLYEHDFCYMHEADVIISNYESWITPFDCWKKDDDKGNPVSPSWWKAYNSIKHNRDEKYKEANLENVLLAISGLLVAELYYYEKITSLDGRPSPKPKFFGLEYFIEPLKLTGFGWDLPWKKVKKK
ncbi:MAG: hypothetical protein GQ534_10550 [Candidatus Delongbacteria bacterium]|nr:hypothetical protein [Candidatus Delongbacteria bacterium]